MTDDDWKGEDKLKIKPKSHKEKLSQSSTIMNAIIHEKRRKKGEPAPAAKRHASFMRLVGYTTWKSGF